MDNTAWLREKQRLAEKYQGNHFRIISAIRRGIMQGKLRSIEAAAQSIHRDLCSAPQVVKHLNGVFSGWPIVFRWYLDNENQNGTLLIRNQSVGLLIQSSPKTCSEGRIMGQAAGEAYLSVSPQVALMLLSSPHRYDDTR